jgi:hypothetical protein
MPGLSMGNSSSTPQLTNAEQQYLGGATGLATNTMFPAYGNYVNTLGQTFNNNLQGGTQAAQNLGSIANQAQKTYGETGESAYRTGVSGLENLFGKDYEANQIAAAMAPAQAQYMQNLSNQGAQFGGTGNLGSARQALAGQQLAGTTQALQAQTAAQIQNNVAQNRLQAGNALMGAGANNLQSALGAAGTQYQASRLPFQEMQQYGAALNQVPGAAYTPNFSGTRGMTGTSSGISGSGISGFLSSIFG